MESENACNLNINEAANALDRFNMNIHNAANALDRFNMNIHNATNAAERFNKVAQTVDISRFRADGVLIPYEEWMERGNLFALALATIYWAFAGKDCAQMNDVHQSTDAYRKISADRDAWQRRAEAAERDLRGTCRSCVHAIACEPFGGYVPYKCDRDPVGVRMIKYNCGDWQWRGPCGENGGTEDGDQTDPV